MGKLFDRYRRITTEDDVRGNLERLFALVAGTGSARWGYRAEVAGFDQVWLYSGGDPLRLLQVTRTADGAFSASIQGEGVGFVDDRDQRFRELLEGF